MEKDFTKETKFEAPSPVTSTPHDIDYYESFKNAFPKYAGKNGQLSEKELQQFFDKELGSHSVDLLLGHHVQSKKSAAREALDEFDTKDEKHHKRLSESEFKSMMDQLTIAARVERMGRPAAPAQEPQREQMSAQSSVTDSNH